MGVASLAMLAACSDDAPMVDGGNTGVVPGDGTTAYMSVVLSAPGDFGRSTDFEDGDDKPGALKPGDEHAINSAKFFFFDENGNFVLNAKIMHPEFGESTNKPNIEWESKSNVLVLENMTSNTFPRYMLTVLNMEEFEAEPTLQATAEALTAKQYHADYYQADENAEKVSNFVMTTSSYKRSSELGATLTSGSTYAVNELTPNDFFVTPTEATNTGNAVEVYVERLAAKVDLDVDVTKSPVKTLADGRKIYKLQQTVAGMDNSNVGDDHTSDVADADLYIEVLGWSLNATATQSHMSKQLKEAWFTTAPFALWETAAKFRSYWAYSYPYTLGAACENALDYIKYVDLDKNQNIAGAAQYCYENTNEPTNILKENPTTKKFDVYNSRVTHVVLNTRLCDENGNDVSALRFRGALYTESHLKKYALNALKNAGKLNYWVFNGTSVDADKTEETNYVQVDVDAIGFKGIAPTMGQVTFEYVGGEQLYAKKVESGVTTFEPVDAATLEAALNDLCNGLELEWYNTRNIYYIPVEHNASKSTSNNVEGYYGVVRNHWYKITVNSFSKIGHAIYDPEDETIIIKPEDPDDTYYYLGARINVLSWRVINQNVDL